MQRHKNHEKIILFCTENTVMRVTYLVETDAYLESGLNLKIKGQFTTWKKAKIDCQLVIVSPRSLNKVNSSIFNNPDEFLVTYLNLGVGKFKFVNKVLKAFALRKAKKIIELFDPDVIYYRQSSWTPGIVDVLKQATVRIFEINSDDVQEIQMHSTMVRKYYYTFTRRFLLHVANGFVCVTNEIGNMYKFLEKPLTVIANGYDVSLVNPRRPCFKFPIRIVFAGSKGVPWHGVDKVLQLAKLLPDIEFHIVGGLLSSSSLPQNVIDHGYLTPRQLMNLYQEMDLGLSTLALFRNGMQDACPLKSREYLAHGLPVIGAYSDPDLSGEEFFLEIPNQEFGIIEAKDTILDFANQWKGKSIDLHRVKDLIDYVGKEQKRLSFMKEVLLSVGLD